MMEDIIGLPAIVSVRYRIVIDKSIRHLFQMPEDGSVQVIVGIDQIQIFPGQKEIKGAVRKDFSKGRFNLPTDWAHRNNVQVGGHVFLIAASDCVLVRQSVKRPKSKRKKELNMLVTGKIIGLPLKIFSNNNIYIPFEYLRFYGISEKKDRLLLNIKEHSLFYQPYKNEAGGEIRSNTRSIKSGLTSLPVSWLRQNKLAAGDRVFLLGTTGGLFLYVRR